MKKKKNTTDQDIEKAKQSKAEPKFAVSTEEAQKSLEDDGIDIDKMVEKYEWPSREDFIENTRKGMEVQMKSSLQSPSKAKQFRAYMKGSMKSKNDPS